MTTLAPCKQYIPRKCKNCAKDNTGKCFGPGMPKCVEGNLINWQPRSVDTPKKVCGACAKWTADKENSAVGTCDTFHVSFTDNYDGQFRGEKLTNCFVPRPVTEKTYDCRECKLFLTEGEKEYCTYHGIKTPMLGHTFTVSPEGERVNCFKPRPAEPLVEKGCNTCGHSSRVTKKECPAVEGCGMEFSHWIPRPAEPPQEYHSDAADALDYALKGLKEAQAKSCQLCGHFHAEPRKSTDGHISFQLGWCDAIHGAALQDGWGIDFEWQLHDMKCKGDKFTPRAALVSNKCQNCEFLRKRECGGGITTDNCSLKNVDIQLHTIDCKCGGCNCDVFKAKTAPACARCGGTENLLDYTIRIGEESEVHLCDKCQKDLGYGKSWQYYYDLETAAGRTWFVDIERVKKALASSDSKDWIIREVKEDVKQMVKCPSCGETMDLVKGVKYCTFCGSELKTVNTPSKKVKELEAENAALARQVAEADTTISRQLVAIDKLNLEIGTVKCDYNDVVTRLNKYTQKVPRRCRRCYQKDGISIKENWPCDALEHKEDCLKNRAKHSKKPAALWIRQLIYKHLQRISKRLDHKKVKLAKRKESEQYIDARIQSARTYIETTKNSLAGRGQ